MVGWCGRFVNVMIESYILFTMLRQSSGRDERVKVLHTNMQSCNANDYTSLYVLACFVLHC
jgi:hypothetical protein